MEKVKKDDQEAYMNKMTKKKDDGYSFLMKYHQGYSIAEISKESGVSIPTITKKLREFGIQIDKHDRSPKIYLPPSAICHVYPYNLVDDMIRKRLLEYPENAEDVLYRIYIPDVMNAISFLEPQRRWILESRFRCGHSNQDIGTVLGFTREYVRQSLFESERQIGAYLSQRMMTTSQEVKSEIHSSILAEYRDEYMKKNKIESEETFLTLPINCIGSGICPLNILSILKHCYNVQTYGDMALVRYQDLCYDKHIGKEMADQLVQNFQRIGIGIDMSGAKKGEKVADSGLSTRAQHALAKHNLVYLDRNMSGYNFSSMKGVGKKLSKEIADCCSKVATESTI